MSKDFFGAMIEAAEAAPEMEHRLSRAMGAEVKIEECLRARHGRTIYAATFDGRSVILKCGVSNADAIKTEIDHQRRTMSTGPNRVVECLAALEDVVVMERAPGRSVQLVLDDLGRGAARDAVLAQCGAWAVAYAGTDKEIGKFGSQYWLRSRVKALAGVDVAPAMKGPLDDVMAWLSALAGRIGGACVSKGHVHGDLTPMNLHMDDEGVLWGFDIGAGVRFPFARELARFMVTWMRSSDVEDGFGEREMLALAEPILTEPECETVLPFFLGEQIAGRLAEQAPDDARADRIRRMASTLLERYP